MAEGGVGVVTAKKKGEMLRELFGDFVVKGDVLEKIPIESFLGEGKVVGVYLSGHWCPPCKQFTPILAEWYEEFKEGPNGDKFEIIFVSSDKSESEFMHYFMTMPWTALPYIERERKTEISTLFNVSGIPVLLLLDPNNCDVISDDGRSIIMEDEKGEDFPWMPIPILNLLDGELFKCAGESVSTFNEIAGKTYGIFFGAKWSPPCVEFMDKLAIVYNAVNSGAPETKFEVIFASTDPTEEDYQEFMPTMPWYALPYGDRRRKRLFRSLRIEAIPAFVTVDKDGRVINDVCLSAVEQDPEGKKFPWYRKPVMELDDEAVEKINDFPCLIWLTKSELSALDHARGILEPISEMYHKTLPDIYKAKKSKRLLHFYYGGATDEDDVGEQLRSFADLPEQTPLLAILDVPRQSKFIFSKKKLTKQSVTDFVKGFQQDKLPKLSLELD